MNRPPSGSQRPRAVTQELSLRDSVHCPEREDGSTLVELAVSLSALMTVLFGIFSTSLALYAYVLVSNAAREASRYAIVRGNTFTSDCSTSGYANCIAQNADIQTHVQSLGYPAINTSHLTATTTWLTSSGISCGTADTCKSPGNFVHVTISYPCPLNILFLSNRTLNLSSSSQMVVVQ